MKLLQPKHTTFKVYGVWPVLYTHVRSKQGQFCCSLSLTRDATRRLQASKGRNYLGMVSVSYRLVEELEVNHSQFRGTEDMI